jgi:transcription termination factor NusB
MSKQLTSQRYILKVHSSRLRRADWNINMSIDEARVNNELIALSDNQILRFIDEVNDVFNPEITISFIKNRIKKLKRNPNIRQTQNEIKMYYKQLDDLLFKPDYMCVVIDKLKDYQKICKNGFIINDITYRRLLGTTGGVKNSTIVFVNEKLLPELKRRIDNGRDKSKEFSPAKLEAYQALTCSASTPVSMPKGIVVVKDCITKFKTDYIKLDDSNMKQPKMQLINDYIELNDSDGYGLAMPSLMERWSNDIEEDYILSGCVIRNSFCKGAVFCVDFQKFARDNGIKYIQDVWGAWHHIDRIELVLTESMLKLWDSYQSIYMYLYNCKKNNYTFSITKASEEELENERTMNYQFLQSYDFTDEQIDELIESTINEIYDILSGDYRKTLLYIKGTELNKINVQHLDNDFSTALMIDKRMMNDPFVRNRIHSMIRKRINEAKVGVLNVPANYSLVSGDPYSLCQSMFGLKVTGLLKAGQMYSKYWLDKEVNKIASFRAPMTCHNNIRVFEIVHNEEMDEFYKYMKTISIFNSWDTSAHAMNGLDKDGDCVINVSMPLIVENTKILPAIICEQRKAPKCVPTEDSFIQANINSFGNAVGEITNKITSMIEVQSQYKPNTREYNILDYRIKCGQLYQQNAIDKTKGIESNPMPEEWHNWISNKYNSNYSSKQNKNNVINRTIIADKKPYFMQYIYPKEKHKYEDYKQNNNDKCIMQFGITFDELLSKEKKTKEEEKFIYYYYKKIPLGMNPCIINKICWKIESKFDNFRFNNGSEFDYSILKSDTEYSKDLYEKVSKIYNEYKTSLSNYSKLCKKQRIKSNEKNIMRFIMKETFKKACYLVCTNEEILCNIVLDMCYTTNNSKQFAWDICGDVFIKNLLKRNNYEINYPTLCESGDILFNGQKFKMEKTKINVEIEMEEEDCQ